MELTKTSNDWLSIELGIARGGNEDVTFQVKFKNNGDLVHELEFSNRSAKAEFMCLTIVNEEGKLVSPQRREIPRLKKQEPDSHTIEPAGNWAYDLRGKILWDGWLEFRGAAYNLKKGKVYLCSFDYMGVMSNQCKFSVEA
jgi:hypothetical protein